MDSMGVIDNKSLILMRELKLGAMEFQMGQKGMKYNHDSHKNMKGDYKA